VTQLRRVRLPVRMHSFCHGLHFEISRNLDINPKQRYLDCILAMKMNRKKSTKRSAHLTFSRRTLQSHISYRFQWALYFYLELLIGYYKRKTSSGPFDLCLTMYVIYLTYPIPPHPPTEGTCTLHRWTEY
jgi:hypothetical protein